jgi:chromosome condensin MukBEF complex kleisin-like MukF subunit
MAQYNAANNTSIIKAGTPRRIPRPVKPWEDAIYPYTSLMADEDTVLEEAMDTLKQAGQRIRATQSLMRSEDMTDGENHRDLSRASLRRSP